MSTQIDMAQRELLKAEKSAFIAPAMVAAYLAQNYQFIAIREYKNELWHYASNKHISIKIPKLPLVTRSFNKKIFPCHIEYYRKSSILRVKRLLKYGRGKLSDENYHNLLHALWILKHIHFAADPKETVRKIVQTRRINNSYHPSDKTRKKLRDYWMAHPRPSPMFGKHHTEDARSKMRDTWKQKYAGGYLNYLQKLSPSQRQEKIREMIKRRNLPKVSDIKL